MAFGNVGQRVPLILKIFQADGVTPATVDGEPVWATGDESIAEVRVEGDQSFAYLLGQGATDVTVTVDADRGPGMRPLIGVGQVVVNDPSTEAQIIELELGDAEDVPA